MSRRTAFLVACLLPLLGGRVATAHPVSHTDVWIRAGESLEVRLNVFLDDVARHQGLPLDTELISADAMRLAIERHPRTLVGQLRIFDESGQPLIAEVTSTPTWMPPPEGIRLAADASLKLTWKLRYSAADESGAGSLADANALTFLHDFTHESLQQPGELRLHLQHEASGRRIDATVRPLRPHTIAFPNTESSSASELTTGELSGLVARLTVTRPRIMLELTAPLMMCEGVSDATQGSLANVDPTRHIHLEDASRIRSNLAGWFQEQVQCRVNDELRQPEFGTISLLSVSGDEFPVAEQPATTNLRNESVRKETADVTIPVIGTRAGIRIVWRLSEEARSIQVALTEPPGDFDTMTVHAAADGESRTFVVPVHPSGARDLRSEDTGESAMTSAPVRFAAEFQWTRSSADTSAAGELSRFEFNTLANNPLWLRSETNRAPAIVLGILVAAVALVTGRMAVRHGRFRSYAIPVVVLAAGVPVTQIWWFAETQEVDTNRCRQLVGKLLDSVYRTVLLNDDRLAVDRLSMVLDPNTLEDVYVSSAEYLGSDPAEVPMIDIQSVDCDELVAGQGLKGNRQAIEIDCRWSVRGTVTHWGHTHDRDLRLNGNIVIWVDDGRWKILFLTPTSPPEFRDVQTPPVSIAFRNDSFTLSSTAFPPRF